MTSSVDELIDHGDSGRRVDARRNVERLVAAARSALEDEGLGVTTREVARRAGVGLGTLYRQVPSLEALLQAILSDSIAEMTAQAVQAMHDPDPWHAFAGFAETFVQLRAASCGLNEALSLDHDDVLDREIDKLRLAVRRLVRHAQEAGVLRTDVNWRDVPFVLASAIPADHTIGLTAKADQWKRNLKIILKGLRVEPATTVWAVAG
jgi:AcrR family transcriptional regulator